MAEPGPEAGLEPIVDGQPDRIARLEEEVAALREQVAALREELGA